MFEFQNKHIKYFQRYLVAAIGYGFAVFDIKLEEIICKPHYSHLTKVLHLAFVCDW